jgi:guanine nucleotide-binding protein G(i) subunit alpha
MGNKNKKNKKNKDKDEKPLSVLLLGAGESGKSTIFKQMKILYHNGYSTEERENFKPIIQRNIVEGMMSLIQASLKLGIAIKKPENRV